MYLLQVASADVLGEGDAQSQRCLLVCLPRQIAHEVLRVGGVFSCDWRRNRVRSLKHHRSATEGERGCGQGEEECKDHIPDQYHIQSSVFSTPYCV